MKTAKGASNKRAFTPGVEHIGSRSNRTINTLHGNGYDAKAKTTGPSASSERATNPGVEQIDSKTNRSINTLYGNDLDGMAKAKASMIHSEHSRTPGAQQISAVPSSATASKHTSTTNTLYGRDEDAKAKTSIISSGRAKVPGVMDRVFSPSMHTTAGESNAAANTLYGDGADTKAKAKASRRSTEAARNPGVETILANNSTHTAISTLYGSEADSKAKTKASGGGSKFASNPGVASVGTADTSTVATLYGNDADTKARIRASRGGAGSLFAAVPGAESLDNPTTTESTDSYHVQHVTIAEEPIARPVSIEMGHTDSESESISEPERNMDAVGRGLSPEAMESLQLPNDPEVPSRRHGKSEKEGVNEDQKKSRKKRCIILFLFFLFLIGAAGVAIWYFLLRNDSGNEASQIGNTNVQDPTASPAASFPPTQPSGIGNTTIFPSASPSNRFIYDPPSKSDCQDIAANQTIAGRETMENADFELGVEVVLPGNTTLSQPLLQALLDAIQRKILPSLAGCSVIIDELIEAWRFVIFDAFVTGRVPPGEACIDETLMQLNCHRVSVKLDLFLKGGVRFLDILALISDEGDNIANHLELDDIFSVIKLTGAESLIPTDAPTRMPSATPSFSPTELPTVQASSNPTGTPSVLPTRGATGKPSLSPTMLPSEAPSMAARTTAPTSDRSVQPTGVPSENPSVRPTIMFSGSPTPPPSPAPSSSPTRAPTKLPTFTPTKTPTLMPSHLPSISPTDSPSLSPSDSPTKFPTLAPSSKPSTSPSVSPTPAPTTPAPTYAVEIITQAHGPYTNYPVSQSTTGWGGDAIRAIDGNNEGRYAKGSVTSTLNELDQWWQVDLATGAGRPVVVSHITVWNRSNPCVTDRIIGAVVQLLDANQNDITPSNVDNVLPDARETTIDYGLVPDVSFVKISKDYFVSLAEVEIYGYVPL